MNRYPHLLSPLGLGRTEVRNRILISAHVPGFAEDNKPGGNYIAYHRTYAANGVGLQITGATPVHSSGMLGTAADALWNLDDGIVPGYRLLAASVHDAGGRILAQLAHAGGTVLIGQPGYAGWSASAVRAETSGNIPHAMTRAQIDEVIGAFAAAAARVRRGGLDGVEILAAFGFLPQAFLSPLTNLRRDDYGGDLDRRLRFTLELLEAVRGALGPDPVLGIRIPGDEFEPGGLTLADMKVVARRLAASGSIDYLSVIAHTNFSHTGRSRHWAPTPAPHGMFIPLAAAIRAVVDIPVFGVGRVTSPQLAERIVAAGQADVVGMTRAHICDPALTAMTLRDEPGRIRPCVGANTCVANRYAGKPIRCMHNAEIASPGERLGTAAVRRRIAIIGAGPAGLEAARVAAERGHAVQLFEAGPRAGGQLLLWSSIASMAELAAIVDWRCAELRRLGVEIVCDRRLTPADATALQCDAVVIATGSRDYTRALAGDHAIRVLSPHAVLRQGGVEAERAIVLNDGRGQAGLVAAERLCDQGAAVEIVTSDIAVANDLDPTLRDAWYTRLGRKGCEFSANLVGTGAQENTLALRNVFDQRAQTRGGIDLLVDWPGCRADDAFDRAELDCEHHAIGDCVAPRTVELAIAEAVAVARKL